MADPQTDQLTDLLNRSALLQMAPQQPQTAAPISTQQAAGVPPASMQAAPAIAMAGMGQQPPAMEAAPIGGASPQRQKDQAELDRVNQSGSGISQFQQKHHILGGLLRGLDIAGSVIAPGLAMQIPGTTLHHQELLNQANSRVTGDLANESEEAKTAETQSLPALHNAQSELAQSKLSEKQNNDQAKLAQEQAKTTNGLHEHGFKQDEKGNIVPLAYEEMSPQQQAVHDLKASQEELADANAAFTKAKKDNIPVQMEMARQRIQSANHNASIASQRLGLSERQFNMRAYGTDNGGNALPGAMINDDGRPVGTAFQQNVRPTGQERNKADLASSAHDQLADIKSIVAKRPDIFGPVNGRKTDFNVWLGSQDPDAQRFRAARTIAGDHLAGVFGGRSEAALNALDHAIGQFKDNPAAVSAGIDQLDKANDRFVKKGPVKTAGSDAVKQQASGPTAGTVEGGYRFKGGNPSDQKNWEKVP
jgi:hypothetical protein